MGKASKLEPGETLLTVDPAFNALSVVFRDANSTRFVKYLERDSPGNRMDISAEFDVHKLDLRSAGRGEGEGDGYGGGGE